MTCWLCGVALTSETDSKEHIIPQAIGGRKTVSGFICKHCNNETGAAWDARLLKFLEFITMFVNPSREDGKRTPAVNATGDDGLDYLIPPRSPGKPLVPIMKHPRVSEKSIREDKIIIEGTFESEAEARTALEKMKNRKYHDIDVEREMVNAIRISRRPRLTQKIEFNANCEKSIVKTALALACSNGVNREDCEYAIDYLHKPYSTDTDIVFFVDKQPIPTQDEWHSVFIIQVENRLVSYVSWYNWFHFLIILSQDYVGEFVAMSYAVDPVSGMEIDRTNWLEVFGVDD